jgi:hypothetical protein
MSYILNLVENSASASRKQKSGPPKYLQPVETGFQPLRPDHERPLIFRIARLLHPDRPIVWLAWIADHRGGERKVAFATARTWVYGRKHWAYGSRRPQVALLRKLRGLLQAALPTHGNQRAIIELSSLLDQYIWLREREPQRGRTGFNEIKVRDGPGTPPRDGRNRRGRPRSWSTNAPR